MSDEAPSRNECQYFGLPQGVCQYCKTLIFRGYFILAILAVMAKSAKIYVRQYYMQSLTKAHIKITDRPDMTLDVYRRRKSATQHNNKSHRKGETDEYLRYCLYCP